MTESLINWHGKTAVVTGGASGIGRAIVEKSINAGMNVVLADINETNMQEVLDELNIDSSRIITVRTDVTQFESVQNLATRAFETYGKVDILFNNAGVADNTFVWESSLKDWNWVLGVNLMGVVHGLKAFVPKMLEQDDKGYIVNTSSLSGLMSANLGIYSVTKHAVVALSETLQQELSMIKSKLKVAVLCPGFIRTGINTSERNRPKELLDEDETLSGKELRPEQVKIKKFVDKVVSTGMDPKVAVDILFKELEEGKFYIMTHKDERTMQSIKVRMEGILEGVFKG